jgi:hypothetical protein
MVLTTLTKFVLIRPLGVVCPSTQERSLVVVAVVAGVYSVVVVGRAVAVGEVVASWIWNYGVAGNRMKLSSTNG